MKIFGRWNDIKLNMQVPNRSSEPKKKRTNKTTTSERERKGYKLRMVLMFVTEKAH